MQRDQLHLTITLRDQRRLGYAIYGREDGYPVFYFTGGNSSRYEGKWLATAAEEQDIKLIVADRPGFGLSDFQPKRKFLDWPDDLIALADSLSIERFSTFGLSGGGPHVLACAHSISARMDKAAVISGVAPPEMPERFDGMWAPVKLIFLTARYMPAMNRFALKQMAGFYSDVEGMKKRMVQAMTLPDRQLIERNPEIVEVFAQATHEAHRNGIDGDALEWGLYVNPWGFKIEEIRMPVKLWYGIHDRQVPVGMGRYLAQLIPNAELVEVEDGGHFSTINNHIEEIFAYLKDQD